MFYKKIRNFLFKQFNRGSACYCLFCNKSYGKFLHAGVKSSVFKKFKVAGGGFKKNIRCQNCGSSSRNRLLALFIAKRTNITSNKTKILHISPDPKVAKFIRSKSNSEHIVGALEPEKFSEFAAERLDVQKLPFGENYFDYVFCCHVLEHVDDDEKAMSEIFRVLKTDGKAILQVPFATNLEITIEDENAKTDKQRVLSHGQKDHVRLYGRDYLKKIQEAGFELELDNPKKNNWLDDAQLERQRLDPLEDIIIGKKLLN